MAAGSRDVSRNRQFYDEKRGLSHLMRTPGEIEEAAIEQAAASAANVTVPSSPSFPIPPTAPPPYTQQKVERVMPPRVIEVATRTTTTPEPVEEEGKFVRYLKNGVNELKNIFGFNTKCHNGGTVVGGSNRCICPALYEGTNCEKKVCLHGGTAARLDNKSPYECKCPYPQFISGPHCETIQCANHAPLLTSTNGSWSCDCTDRHFYQGKFCEEFSAPYAVFVVPALFLLLFIVCCAVCRMDLCPRRRRAPSARQIAEQQQQQARARRRTAVANARARGMENRPVQEMLLAEERGVCVRSQAYPQGVVAPYVIRLDTIPHFNPNMIGGVEPIEAAKPLEPPPSYEQAVAATPLPAIAPPSYTERPLDSRILQQPPPPSRAPPPPPNS